MEARRRGLAIAQDSGNRTVETILAAGLSSLEAKYGDPTAAFDYVTVAIRSYHESGNTSMIGIPLVVLAALFDRLGRHEAAATIAGFAFNPLTAAAVSEINTAIAHLRDVLGHETYESLARKGETMTTTAIVTLRIRPNRPGPSRTERRLEIVSCPLGDARACGKIGVRSLAEVGGSWRSEPVFEFDPGSRWWGCALLL